jgi:hypothetical protein
MKNFNDLTPSEKAKLTRVQKKASQEFCDYVKDADEAFYGFLKKEIYPIRDAKIDNAKKVRDAKIAEANAEYETIREEALEWQNTHPEVVRLGAIKDTAHKKAHEIETAKNIEVKKKLGLHY